MLGEISNWGKTMNFLSKFALRKVVGAAFLTDYISLRIEKKLPGETPFFKTYC